jgi:hypothetical protein
VKSGGVSFNVNRNKFSNKFQPSSLNLEQITDLHIRILTYLEEIIQKNSIPKSISEKIQKFQTKRKFFRNEVIFASNKFISI